MVNPGKKLKKILLISGITGVVYGGFKYLLPLVIPFLFSYAAALGLRPSVRYLEKKLCLKCGKREFHVPAAVIGAFELILITNAVSAVLYFGSRMLLEQINRLVADFPRWILVLDWKLTSLCRIAERAMGLEEDYVVIMVRDMLTELGNMIKKSTMPALMNNSVAIFSEFVNVIVFLLLFYVSTLLFLQEMENLREKKSSSMFHREFALIGRRLFSVVNAWFKTQLVIMSVTSVLCIIGLLLIRNPYSFILGIGIGFLDALPIFGTGTVLIPWAIIMFMQKRWIDGVVLFGLYVICYFEREILEARLMGNKMGISALETLISMYVGLKLFGVAGFLLGPVGFLLIEDLLVLYEDGAGECPKK